MRRRVALPLGEGLDRASGALAVSTTTVRDLRNVHLLRGQLQVRRGSVLASTTGGPVAGGCALRKLNLGVLAAEASGALQLYTVAADGTAAAALGAGQLLASGADSPARVVCAESFDRVFVAHDEPVFSRRGVTRYTDASTVLDVLLDLDDDGTGETAARFRGVAPYLDYLTGWGHGSTSPEDNRPELLRISLPGDPTTFKANHYILIGQRGEAVLNAGAVGAGLVVFKATEVHLLLGSTAANFGVRRVDSRYGLAGARLMVEVGGAIFFWSLEGPRVTDGGPSTDLGLALDVPGMLPELQAAGWDETNVPQGFALYRPERREVEFVFGRFAFVLSLWDSQAPRWSYRTYPAELHSGFILYGQASSGPGAPTGYAEAVSATGDGPHSVAWRNVGVLAGDEIEVHRRTVSGGVWALVTTVAYNNAEDQSVSDTGTASGTVYEWALRVKRGLLYGEAYTDADPSTWPAISRVTNEVGSTLTAPALDSAVWSRTDATTTQVSASITPAYTDRGWELLRDGAVVGTAAAGAWTISDASVAVGTTYSYTARHVNAGVVGNESNAVRAFTGPSPEPASPALTQVTKYDWRADLPASTDPLEVWVDGVLEGTVAAGTAQYFGSVTQAGSTVRVKLRRAVTHASGVTDYTQFSAERSLYMDPNVSA